MNKFKVLGCVVVAGIVSVSLAVHHYQNFLFSEDYAEGYHWGERMQSFADNKCLIFADIDMELLGYKIKNEVSDEDFIKVKAKIYNSTIATLFTTYTDRERIRKSTGEHLQGFNASFRDGLDDCGVEF